MSTPLLRIKDLKKYFPIKVGLLGKVVGYVKAVDGVSFDIDLGEVVSIVGESGSGKTTIAKCILLLERLTYGKILYNGEDVTLLRAEKLREYRRSIQAVFQNPFLSLDPRMNVFDILAEPVKINMKLSREELYEYISSLLNMVGLDRSFLDKYPHELSGGQAQRVAIARAISLKPRLIILDEPTSALDVSVQAQILNLLADLKNELNLSYLLITHDLSIVKYISDRIIVVYLGRIMEEGLSEEILDKPLHPYTQTLFSAIPDPYTRSSRERIILRGEPPSPINPPPGCRFHTRCPYVMEVCKRQEPDEIRFSSTHKVYCWLYVEK
ncbi:MAG: ATP-binding cassette domain-containing protein [Aigarchaeota archaeon]|nr:ATP-binding cassette domain-containing protein [Aigarchaeota archaeon]MCX8193067.1 ATP-binding cassette domain-containing protein [Nitrososphaeria archaeon]MDW7986916.1 ATP-binding cassette domain-containing protein [Nitrososphaerota archaeon]